MTSRSRSVQPIFGAVTRISGDPSWNRNLKNTWDWPVVNALINLTWPAINAVYTSRTGGLPAINALVKLTTGNVNAIHT